MLDDFASTSRPRALRPEDFPAEQLDDWIAASGSARQGASSDAPLAEGRWFVAYTNPRREAAVERALRPRGFDVYVPVMTVTQRRQTVSRPALPRYLFLRPRGKLTVFDLRETPGLEGVVRDADGAPARLDEGVIAGFRAYQADGTWDFTDARWNAEAAAEAEAERAAHAAALVPGVTVRIVGGPYRQWVGKVVARLDDVRRSVRLKLFGRDFDVPMPLVHLVAIC